MQEPIRLESTNEILIIKPPANDDDSCSLMKSQYHAASDSSGSKDVCASASIPTTTKPQDARNNYPMQAINNLKKGAVHTSRRRAATANALTWPCSPHTYQQTNNDTKDVRIRLLYLRKRKQKRYSPSREENLEHLVDVVVIDAVRINLDDLAHYPTEREEITDSDVQH